MQNIYLWDVNQQTKLSLYTIHNIMSELIYDINSAHCHEDADEDFIYKFKVFYIPLVINGRVQYCVGCKHLGINQFPAEEILEASF